MIIKPEKKKMPPIPYRYINGSHELKNEGI
jgi:hypothetical protein